MLKIAIYGKGGIGKSTVTSNLSAAFASMGKRVIQIGCDPKADSTINLLGGKPLKPVIEILKDGVDPTSAKEISQEGFGGVLCIETGGPTPGLGCAGRGIIATFNLLDELGLFEEYKLDDAELAIVCMNSTAGTTKYVVDKLREQGVKAGLLKIRVFRPFPDLEIANALAHVKAIAVLDKSDSLSGVGGALYSDVTSALYVHNVNVPAVNYIYGIGGRDTRSDDIEFVYKDLEYISRTRDIGIPYRYLGLRR